MAVGKIVQVIGTVVDVEFPPDELPNLFDALELDNNGESLTLEVQQHISEITGCVVLHWVLPMA